MKVAMVGTRGVPARYGGFETAVEEVGRRLVERGHEVVVYCRQPGAETFEGMQRVVLPAVRHRVFETLSHSFLSSLHAARNRPDVAFLFNAANSPVLPILHAARIPVAVHVDGLEWKRSKWSGTGRKYYLTAEGLSVAWADALIADAKGIADYYEAKFATGTELIAYGAPQLPAADEAALVEQGLTPHGYHLVVARTEPENHVDLIVEAYRASSAALPLVVVGGVVYETEYQRRLSEAMASDARIRSLGTVHDQDFLNSLYAGAYTYMHGHSVGGTNPSLLRAMGAGTSVVAMRNVFNHEVLGGSGFLFQDAAELKTHHRGAGSQSRTGRGQRDRHPHPLADLRLGSGRRSVRGPVLSALQRRRPPPYPASPGTCSGEVTRARCTAQAPAPASPGASGARVRPAAPGRLVQLSADLPRDPT